MFGSTYVRESMFSAMKNVTSQIRNRMADEAPDDSLRLATTYILVFLKLEFPTFSRSRTT